MGAWTMENTGGYTPDELAMINEVRASVLDTLLAWLPDEEDEKSLDDAINNTWREGMTRAELETAVRRVMRLT